MTWADGAAIKAEVDLQQKVLLGPKTAEDLKPPEPTKQAGKGKEKAAKGPVVPTDAKPNKSKDKVAASGDSAATAHGKMLTIDNHHII
jgi:hypothetical protein